MKKLLFPIFATIALAANLGCPKPALPPTQFNNNRPFPIKVGQTAESREIKGFIVKFEKVSADSRCPKGVECITAGQADVVLTLTKEGESQTMTLPFTLPNGTSNVTDFRGHTVRIVGVSPFKFKDKEIKPEEYEIVLTIIETPPPVPKAKVGENFSLGVGESIVLEEDLMFRIRFDTVSGDSRCPEGVQCIWAGRVDAGFTLMQGDSSSRVRIATGDFSQGGKSEAKFGPYTLKIINIAPPKIQSAPIPQKAYKVTLVVIK